MNTSTRIAALSLLALSLSACAPKQVIAPDAYRATPQQLMDTIAAVAPILSVKALNQPYHVTRRTATELVVATPLKAAGHVVGLLLGQGFSTNSANITYHFVQQGPVTLVSSTINPTDSTDLVLRRNEIAAVLDKTFVRVR